MIAASILLLLLIIPTQARHKAITIQGLCLDFPPPVVSNRTTNCGVPDNVDINQFGDNLDTSGTLTVTPRKNSVTFSIKLYDLPRPNLVITAWLIWEFSNMPLPELFQVAADVASPLAATTAAFTTGLGYEPNKFKYYSSKDAYLKSTLDFNPTYPNEGPVTFKGGSFQKDVPGIQDTRYKHFPLPDTGTFTPTTSAYIRQYDRKTGFEKLGKDGRPLLVRSPIAAKGIAIASHLDRTTHGVSQGDFPFDHYTVIFFPLGKNIGRRIVSTYK